MAKLFLLLLISCFGLLVIGWMLGVIRVSRVIAITVVLLVSAVILFVTSIVMYGIIYSDLGNMTLGIAFAISLGVLSLPIAMLFGDSSPTPNPPAEQACKAYQNLDPAQKEAVRGWCKTGVKIAAECGAEHLRKKGATAAADAFANFAKKI